VEKKTGVFRSPSPQPSKGEKRDLKSGKRERAKKVRAQSRPNREAKLLSGGREKGLWQKEKRQSKVRCPEKGKAIE